MRRLLRWAVVSFCLSLVVFGHAQISSSLATEPSYNSAVQGSGGKQRPNILFIIMDDVGIDQMRIFGYGGGTAPSTPNIDAIARAGVRFRNVWSMPECSPSRAIYFEGRYPLRTNINSAILNNDLANSQVSPFEVTTPQILRTKSYKSAMFGKFHLAGPDNNEFTYGTPHVLGWDYFDGFLEGAMHPIDTTIGNQYTTPANTEPIYSCGFIPNRANNPRNGADQGACVQPDKSCTQLTKSASMQNPGFSCVQQGGIFVKDQSCAAAKKLNLGFANANGYYVWGRVINKQDGTVVQYPFTAPSARGYVSDATTSSAVDWIKQQNAKKSSWMTTVSYSNAHTPYQQAPEHLLPGATADTAGLRCTGNDRENIVQTRILSNQMIEAMDTEIGNLMVSAGLARRLGNGTIDYRPEETNTMVIIIGDNGTYAPGVKEPFDLNRAKGYVYQTGVWVPLIVAGPLVDSPDREVKSMISIADLFQLFGEIAGADVHKLVPSSHVLDSQPMLAYLTNRNQPSIRKTNFTQTANNIHPTVPGPCVIALTDTPTCIQLVTGPGLCHYEGGKWYGDTPDDPNEHYQSCCDVRRALYDNDATKMQILPIDQQAVRDDNFKLVRKSLQYCGSSAAQDSAYTVNEFYKVDESVPIPLIDKDGTALCEGTACPNGLSAEQKKIYAQLTASMHETLTSEPSCLGDGNEDKKVNLEDVANWFYFSTNGVKQTDGSVNTSSWYDFNHDGKTDQVDLATIMKNFDKRCARKN